MKQYEAIKKDLVTNVIVYSVLAGLWLNSSSYFGNYFVIVAASAALVNLYRFWFFSRNPYVVIHQDSIIIRNAFRLSPSVIPLDQIDTMRKGWLSYTVYLKDLKKFKLYPGLVQKAKKNDFIAELVDIQQSLIDT